MRAAWDLDPCRGLAAGCELDEEVGLDAGVVECEALAPPEVAEAGALVPSFPEAASFAAEVLTAWWAWLIADWYWPSPGELELLLLELPLSANMYSAKNATVPMRRAMSERDAGIASLIIGTRTAGHESPPVY